MIRSLWIARTGLDAQQTQLDVISNNLANVSTNGFKRARAVFEDLLYQTIRQPGAQSSQQNQLPVGLQLGSGARPVSTTGIASPVARATPAGLIEAEDPDDSFHDWWRSCGARPGHVAIVRPDRFVFALVPASELPAASREFTRQFHRADAVVEASSAQPPQTWAEAA